MLYGIYCVAVHGGPGEKAERDGYVAFVCPGGDAFDLQSVPHGEGGDPGGEGAA